MTATTRHELRRLSNGMRGAGIRAHHGSMTTTTTHHRPTLAVMYAGLALTIAAMSAPFVDRATGQVLAEHIRHGYPAYSSGEVDAVVTTWLAILTTVGALGVVSWVGSIWAVRAAKPWARWLATAAFVAGTSLALTALLTKDTSGEVGLAPLLGMIGLAPCVAGLVAVAALWRR